MTLLRLNPSRWLTWAVVLGMTYSTATPALAQRPPQPSVQPTPQPTNFVLPAPPRTPPPNRTRSGGSLSAATSCDRTTNPIIALVPEENPVLTATDYPTVLVYVPFSAADVRLGEFSVLAGLNEMTRLYRAQFTLPDTPGIVSISLPRSPNHALKEGEFYHWYVKLYCHNSTATRADLEVNGWFQRVAATPEREQQIQNGTPDVWYDALAQVGDRLRTAPNSNLQNRWRELLTFIHLEDLTQEPVVGAVQFVESQ
jgi:hypothetical protein